MGVKGLYTYLRPYRHVVDIENIPPQSLIGVDGLSILYKFRGNTEMILKFLASFQRLQARILFVFDGKAPDIKKEEIDLRKTRRNDAREEANMLRTYLETATNTIDEKGRKVIERKIHDLENGQGWYVTREARHVFQDTLRKNEIEYVKAKGEADDVLMSLWSAGKLYSIISSDMDFLVSGVERLWIPSYERCEEICLSEVLQEEGLEMSSFCDAAILCGVSAGYTFVNMYPQKAFTFMRHYGSLEALARRQPRQFEISKPEVLTQIRERFQIHEKPDSLVREDYRETILKLLIDVSQQK
jgi:5'-3' exonuclease